jgi:preprotein translocase subunit SecD
MLCISRGKAAAILVTVLFVSAMAIPNFLPEKIFQGLPKWAQHRIVPGIEYQGGTRLVLEVDVEDVRRERIEQPRDDVRRVLREAKVGPVQAPVMRGISIEMRVRESDLQRSLGILHNQLAPDVIIESDGNLVRLTVTEATIRASIQQGRRQSINIIRQRTKELGVVGASIEPQGIDRVEVVAPGVDLTRIVWH